MTWNILHVTIKTCAFHSTRSQTQTFERIWFVALSIFLLVTSCSHSFVVSNWRYPFSLLLGFNLWNIAILWFLSFLPRRSLHLLCNHANGQPLSQGSLLPRSTLPALLTCFVMRDILCNSPLKISNNLEVLYGKHVKFTKNGENIIIIDRTQLFIFQMFIIKLRNWIIPFKLALLLVTHDGGKLTRVGELSLAERLQGR